MGKELVIFKNRGAEGLVAVKLAEVNSFFLYIPPVSLFLGQDVRCAARCFEQKKNSLTCRIQESRKDVKEFALFLLFKL